MRDLIFALRAPLFLGIALSARSYAFCIHLGLFLIIWYWSSNQFYNTITDDVNYTISQSHLNFFLNLSETGNSIYLRLYQPWGTYSHHDARASHSIFCIHFSNFLINYMIKIIYFLPYLSRRKNNRRLYLRKRFCRTTLICISHILVIYILWKNVAIQICRS